MLIIKTKDKWDEVRLLTNLWLKDPKMYCNNCGVDYLPEHFPCCENPQVGRNIDHAKGLIKQNKEMTKEAKNKYSSTTDKSLRWGVSMPPALYMFLDNFFKKKNQKLFSDKEDLHKFMKKLPEFRIPEGV